MKCIRYFRKHGGHVVRVSDEQAAQAVKAERATYCPKHWFKAAKLAEIDTPVREEAV